MAPRSFSGFTLVEMVVALAAVAMLAVMALPTFQGRLAEARRGDATAALQRIQVAQDRYRDAHGLYATTLAPLGVAALSSEGLYDLALEVGPGDRYVGRARARADGSQAHDGACAEISLHVEQGFATLGPTTRCWGR
ncbi:MAG: type IV pilin protein [Rubrivivax sp.]|nr:type IV pilin protein [Rubrivivax sp.]